MRQLRSCVFQRDGLFLTALVDKIQHQVKGNNGEVEAVHNKHIVDLSAKDLPGDAGDIADDNGEHKDKALSLGRVGS